MKFFSLNNQTGSSPIIRIYYPKTTDSQTNNKREVKAKSNKAVQRHPNPLHSPNISFNPQSAIASKLTALTKNPVIEIEQALPILEMIKEVSLKNVENEILPTTQSPPQAQEIIQIPPDIKNNIETLINKIEVSDMDIDKELKLSQSLENLRLNDLAIQRLVKILAPDHLSTDNIHISSRLLDLRHSSQDILRQSIQAMNDKLELLLKTPLSDKLESDDDYFHEQLGFADLFSKSVDLAPFAKERLINILNQSSSFFDQKCVYDCLEKNHTFTTKDREGVSIQIITEFKVPSEISNNDYNYAVESLTAISQKSTQGTDLCLRHIEDLLNIAPNTTTNLLKAVEGVNSLMPFREKNELTTTGKHWQALVYSKLNNLSSSPHNEHKLSKFMSLLDLDLINAKRLIPILNTVSNADEFHNIYQASLKHLEKAKPKQKDLKHLINPLRASLQNSLKQIIKNSFGEIDLNETNLQESLKYINLFKPTENQDENLQALRKSMQISTAIKFLGQAKKESSLGELLKSIATIFRTDSDVDENLCREISNNILNLLERNAEPEPKSTIQEKYTNWHKRHPKIMLAPSVIYQNSLKPQH
jgi:hypothetical protein